MMRTMVLATVALLVLGGPVLAENGDGAHPSPFVTWQKEGAAGKHLTPLAQLWVRTPTAAQNGYANSNMPQGYAAAPNAHAPGTGG